MLHRLLAAFVQQTAPDNGAQAAVERVILTGIQPQIAQTLVTLGVNLGEIITRNTLQAGIAYAISLKQ
ncbi:MAG: hypothetical protein HC911_16260 [Chloroflexaceae bacterium]|nr:hypothetical protein [Chloroflexaceae bacterium]